MEFRNTYRSIIKSPKNDVILVSLSEYVIPTILILFREVPPLSDDRQTWTQEPPEAVQNLLQEYGSSAIKGHALFRLEALAAATVIPDLFPIADACLKFVPSSRPEFGHIEELLDAVERYIRLGVLVAKCAR
jgi:hypothetical protein